MTIGSMFPFDRLIRVMDSWAAANPGTELLAQTGEGAYEPRHMPWVRRLDQADFSRTVAGARLVVAHAGMGSVITADQYRKPIVILPRIREQGEHTTDHQIATADWLRGKPGIHVADRDEDLGPRITEALVGEIAGPRFATAADPELLDRIRQYILS